MNNQILHEGETYFDFQVVSIKDLPEYRSQGIRLIHCPTGAEVYHLHNEDRENLFGFIFRTPPYNHTGVAHILEHAVLCGSRRFPLKDPFVTLLKGSMHTFLNAMTFPDKTVYPASSTVENDFYNLMLVYGDAVFSPLLREEVFQQEGWHVEFTNTGDLPGKLKLVGVVYNEMKGKYASPESIVADWSFRSLFPETPYGFDSGGSPERIPDLTYEDFINFHKKYYHPSNCKVFLSGSIPTMKHLEFLQRHFLSDFSKRVIASEIPDQPRWPVPRGFELTYPIKAEDPSQKKSTITLNWITAPVTDPFMKVSLEVLSEILVGHAGSPLRKALMDSKLGEDIAPATGLETEVKEVVFTVGLRGTDPHSLEKVENTVLDTLTKIQEQGIKDELLRAAIHRVKFRNREIKGGGAPYALSLMRKALEGWLHDREPETTLAFNQWMKTFEEKVFEQKDFLPRLIDEFFLRNPHRSTLLVRPDPDHSKREDERLLLRLKNFENLLVGKKKEEMVSALENLKEFQEKPDPPEVLRRIPFLKLHDLPQEVERIPGETSSLPSGVPLVFHDIFSNGIIYIDFAFSTNGVREEESRFLPLFGKAVCGSGLPHVPYDEVARDLSRFTGGFTSFLMAKGEVNNPPGRHEHIFFRTKILRENVRTAFDLIASLLQEADFDDEERLKDLTLELRNELKASLIPHGHQFASQRAGSKLSDALRVEERWKGITQFLFLDSLSSGLEGQIERIRSSLKKLRSLITPGNLVINVTSEKCFWDEVKEALSRMVSALPGADVSSAPEKRPYGSEGSSPTPVESFAIPSNVGYVAKALRGARFGTAEEAYQSVLAHFLRTSYLWEKVRMRGGAYGAFAVPYGTEGVFVFSSYRDPNIVETLQAFRDSLSYAEVGDIDNDHVEKAVIGTVGREEKPLDPGEKGFISFIRKLCGITDELRQKRRELMLGMNRDSLAFSARQLLAEFDQGFTVIMSHKNTITEAGKTLGELRDGIQEIPA